MLSSRFRRCQSVCRFVGLSLACAGFMAPPARAQSSGGLLTYVPVKGAPPALQADVLELDPQAPIIRPLDYIQRGETFLVPRSSPVTAPEAWVQQLADWVEPVTAIDGTLPEIGPEDMLLVETFGYVSKSLPGKKATYGKPLTANPQDALPNGARLTSREGASVAVLIGGLISVRLGENSSIRLNHRVVGSPGKQIWTTSVELEKGYVFCKIGKATGIETRFSVRTPQGRAIAQGTDFVVRLAAERLAVGVAKGTVSLQDSTGKPVGSATSTQKASLRILHLPALADPMQRMTANSEFLRQLLEFIPQLNLKVKSLRLQLENGTPLNSIQENYLDRISKISYLRRVQQEK